MKTSIDYIEQAFDKTSFMPTVGNKVWVKEKGKPWTPALVLSIKGQTAWLRMGPHYASSEYVVSCNLWDHSTSEENIVVAWDHCEH